MTDCRPGQVPGAGTMYTETGQHTSMPTYEYKCTECGHRSEAFQSIRAAPLQECSECGGKLKRLIGTGAGFIFKGSGFYTTDYRSESYQAAAKKDATAAKPDGDTKTDTKKDSAKSPTAKEGKGS